MERWGSKKKATAAHGDGRERAKKGAASLGDRKVKPNDR